ncbi:MAG: hypothetical protein ACRDOO_04710 [Actinomadura sp.]
MRTFNRIASLALGLALIAGGLLTVVESMRAAYRLGPWLVPSRRWYEALSGTRLADRPAMLVAVALGLAGLALLLAELRRRPPHRLPVRPGTTSDRTEATAEAAVPTEWWLLRRPAERRLARTVAELPGVNAARVRLRGKDQWTVTVLAEARDESRSGIEEAIGRELAAFAAPDSARVRLRLRTPRRVT